jgi:hypothetical protein
LNNPHAKQKWNEKKTFDQVKKKVKFKWDELQTPSATNARGMVTLVGMFNSRHVGDH